MSTAYICMEASLHAGGAHATCCRGCAARKQCAQDVQGHKVSSSERVLSHYLSLALASCLCQNRLMQQAEEAVKLKSELQVSLFVLVFSGCSSLRAFTSEERYTVLIHETIFDIILPFLRRRSRNLKMPKKRRKRLRSSERERGRRRARDTDRQRQRRRKRETEKDRERRGKRERERDVYIYIYIYILCICTRKSE
jgi:hypothetical protein